MMRRAPITTSLLICTILTACANWRPIEPATQPVLAERDVVQFDFVGERVRLHAVQFTADSIVGIPWLRHPTCDSCRVTYPLSRVADAKVGRPEESLWFLMLPVGLGFGYLVIYAVRGGN
ncbi:MAG TPA: hypothetical protein VGL65_10625 [Gemmatimonadales bacterium]|jgi:hypothetical protein